MSEKPQPGVPPVVVNTTITPPTGGAEEEFKRAERTKRVAGGKKSGAVRANVERDLRVRAAAAKGVKLKQIAIDENISVSRTWHIVND